MCALTVFGLMPSAFAVSLAAVTLMYEQAGLPRSSSSRSGPPMSARTRLVASGLIRDAMTVNHVWKGCTITVTARPGDGFQLRTDSTPVNSPCRWPPAGL
jgi:hypothetical protein